MASIYINVYKDNPTAGGTDGTAVSTGGIFTAPIQFDLDAAQNETKTLTCAIRTDAGYTAFDVTIQVYNDTDDRFKLCKTANGTFTDSISFDTVTDTNTLFYVKASSADTEQPQTNRKVKLQYSGKIKAVQP